MRQRAGRERVVGARLERIEAGDQRREAVESLIREHYHQRYGASVDQLMPELLTLSGGDGSLLAVMGLRSADGVRLLLESYLDQPVEQVLAERSGRPVARSGVVELGSLVVADPLSARWMVVAVNAYLKGAGFSWVTFTLIPALSNSFGRLGLELLDLAAADGDRLGEARARWGRYYDLQPRVYAGDIEYGYRRLLDQATAGSERLGWLRELWNMSLNAGLLWPGQSCAA